MSKGVDGRAVAIGMRLAVLVSLLLAACSESTRAGNTGSRWWQQEMRPDELPKMLNVELPFHYPVAEYVRNVEGNVMLGLYVDTAGAVVPDSTRVRESSGNAALDAAALAGATQLRFKPARRRGTPIAVTVHFPVQFRHADSSATPPSRHDSIDRR